MNKQSKRFEEIEHTADVGLRIFGKDLKELFINAAIGVLSFIVDAKSLNCQRTIVVKLKEEDKEELLVAWLNELLFQVNTRSFLPSEFIIEEISTKHITAGICGEAIDPSRHKIISEIKATTYHELEIKETNDGFEARVIFDT